MSTTRPSARSSRHPKAPVQQALFQAPDELAVAPEVSESAREELRRIIIGSGRQKGVGIEIFGVSSGETRISRALTAEGSSDWAAFDIDDVIAALEYLRAELKSEKPVADFIEWFCGRLGYEAKKAEPLTIEQRLALLEQQEADDAQLADFLLRNRARRSAAIEKIRGDLERAKDGVR